MLFALVFISLCVIAPSPGLAATCDPGYTYIPGSGCYDLTESNGTMTWDEAVEYCAGKGGYLVRSGTAQKGVHKLEAKVYI